MRLFSNSGLFLLLYFGVVLAVATTVALGTIDEGSGYGGGGVLRGRLLLGDPGSDEGGVGGGA